MNLLEIILWLALSLATSIAVAEPAQSDTTLPKGIGTSKFVNADGFVLIAGEPRLILGMYGTQSDEHLQELADNGFNLVRVRGQADAELDRFAGFGLYGWVVVHPKTDPQNPEKGKRLASKVNAVKDHPALLTWELPDEAIWNLWWHGRVWSLWDERKEVLQLIEARAEAGADEQTVAEWNRRLTKANRLTKRNLWAEGEAVYDELWADLGEACPHPQRRLSNFWADVDAEIERLQAGCELLRNLDGKHMIWANHAARNAVTRLAQLNAYVDAAGCDHYPVKGVDDDLAEIGFHTDRMRAAAPGKSCWMVLQGFGWRDLDFSGERWSVNPDKNIGRRPNLRETRFMAYNAIMHGANAILYYGTDFIEGGPRGGELKDGEEPQLWKDMMTVGRELRALEPALLGEAPAKEPASAAKENIGYCDDQGPVLMLRKTGEDWVLIAVNETPFSTTFTVSDLPAELEGATLHRLYSGESRTVKAGGFRDGIRDWGVHIYATSRRLEATQP